MKARVRFGSSQRGMLADLYWDIARYLIQGGVRTNFGADNVALGNLPQQLLDTIHTVALQIWLTSGAKKARLTVIEAHDDWHIEMQLSRFKRAQRNKRCFLGVGQPFSVRNIQALVWSVATQNVEACP